MDIEPSLGVIGGSGLYNMSDLEGMQEFGVTTPFGKPSSPLIIGRLAGVRVAFLARHGIGHFINPSEINYRANIYALKQAGVTRIVSISACGSLREDYAPGNIIIPDQLVDFTRGRERSFFSNGMVAHIGVADPFCPVFSRQLAAAVQQSGATSFQGGSFITVEGPRFSTRGESNLYRSWGMSLIGMTTSPEAFLAREAELCYAVMAHVTDYDVWHMSVEPVSVDAVIAVLNQNTRFAQDALKNLALGWSAARDCDCENALSTALITNPERIPAETRSRLDLLVRKYLK
jgi:5'-methylthioadenosine phosphorylase